MRLASTAGTAGVGLAKGAAVSVRLGHVGLYTFLWVITRPIRYADDSPRISRSVVRMEVMADYAYQ